MFRSTTTPALGPIIAYSCLRHRRAHRCIQARTGSWRLPQATGIVTRRLRDALPLRVSLTATDFSRGACLCRRLFFLQGSEDLGCVLVGKNGAPEEIRTPAPQIRSLVLYPAELRVRGRNGRNRWRGRFSKASFRGMQVDL